MFTDPSNKIVFFVGWGGPRAVQEKVKQLLVNFDPNFAPDAPAPSLSIVKSETSLPGKALSFKREVLSSV